MGNTFFYNELRKGSPQIGWKDIFSESFKKHSKAELEYALSAGTGLNTSTPENMLQRWQKPWLWLRILVGGIAVCVILYLCFLVPQQLSEDHSVFLALVLINYIMPPFVSAFVVMVLIWELNIPRNISIYAMMGYLLLGGAFSIAFTQLLSIAGVPSDSPPMAPLTEEPGKLIAAALFLALAAHSGKRVYGLTGLLIGAGVGAGFTIFESIQYVFNLSGGVEDALYLALRRSIPLFGGHILFCAPYAAGLALGYSRTGTWSGAWLCPEFWISFLCSCFAHFWWNYNQLEPMQWVIAAALWFELLFMIRKCLGQAVQEGRYIPSGSYISPSPAQYQGALVVCCISGPLSGQQWRFQDGALILGREAGSTIQVPANARGVSRHHCRLQKVSGNWFVEDLNASYGTYLTGGRIPPGEQRPLRSGEIVYLGSKQNAFRIQIDQLM